MKKRITSATLAAVMTLGMMSGFTASAEAVNSRENPKKISFVDIDGDKDYDEADWESYKERYWRYWHEDDDYDGSEIDLQICDNGLIYKVAYDGTVWLAGYIGKGEDLVLPEEIDGIKVTAIEYGFNDLKTVKTVTIESKIKHLETVFMNCPNLEKVVLPDGLESISQSHDEQVWYNDCKAFSKCPKLKEVYLPDSLQTVLGACFENTPWLKERENKEGLVIIGECLLSGRKAEGKVVIPDTVTHVCWKAFHNNKKMTELVVPGTIGSTVGESLNTNIFILNCTALTKITFKNGCEVMFDFVDKKGAPNLKKVILPPSFDYYATGWAVETYDQPTYYYYNGTPAASALKQKKYSKIKKAVLPGKTKSFKATGKKRAIKTNWKAVSTATGYQIQVSTNKKFKKVAAKKYIKNWKKTTYTFKNLRSGRKYYVRMRTYKKIDGKNYYGLFTKVRVVKVK